MSFEFIESCVEAYGLGDRLRVVIATQGQDVAIAPLYHSADRHCLELVGQDQICEAADFLYEGAGTLSPLAHAVVALGQPLHLGRIPSDSAAIAALETAYRGRGLVVKRPAAGCPWIALDESWSEPEQHLNSGRRSDFRRALRNAEKFGEVKFEIHTPELSELDSLLDEMYAVESAGWKARDGSALAVDARIGAFFRSYAASACRNKVLRLAFMRIGGRAVAAQFAIEANGGYWLMKIGYDEEFKRCSPGTLLIMETIRHAARAGVKFYEFLGAEESWIDVWKPNLRACVRVQTYPFNFRGARALLTDTYFYMRAHMRRKNV